MFHDVNDLSDEEAARRGKSRKPKLTPKPKTTPEEVAKAKPKASVEKSPDANASPKAKAKGKAKASAQKPRKDKSARHERSQPEETKPQESQVDPQPVLRKPAAAGSCKRPSSDVLHCWKYQYPSNQIYGFKLSNPKKEVLRVGVVCLICIPL